MHKYSKVIFQVLMAISVLLVACEEEEEYPALTFDQSIAPSLDISVVNDSTTDESTYVQFSTNTNAVVYLVAVEASGLDSLKGFDLINGKYGNPAKHTVTAGISSMVKLKGFDEGSAYEILAVATNLKEGKYGDVEVTSFTTTDPNPPVINTLTTNYGTTKVPHTVSSLLLEFNEAVSYTGRGISIINIEDLSELNIVREITVNNNKATIELTTGFNYGALIAVTVEAGAFIDANNNPCAAYQTNETDEYILSISVAPKIDLSEWQGAYKVTEFDYITGETYEYNSIIKPGSNDSSLTVINFWDVEVASIEIQLEPEKGICYIEEQNTGIYSATYDEDLYATSNNIAETETIFSPGVFDANNKVISVHTEIFISLGNFAVSDFTYTKISNESATTNSMYDINTATINKRKSQLINKQIKYSMRSPQKASDAINWKPHF